MPVLRLEGSRATTLLDIRQIHHPFLFHLPLSLVRDNKNQRPHSLLPDDSERSSYEWVSGDAGLVVACRGQGAGMLTCPGSGSGIRPEILTTS